MHQSYHKHRDRVNQIAEKVKNARKNGEKPTIYHGSSHSVRPEQYETDEKIHVERLNHFIDVDKEEQTVLMEPDITMRELVNETLEHGLIPHVVPEFPTITVGGAIQGGAGESSCFKYGGFGKHCNKYEIVTGEGELLEVTPNKNEDLYKGTFCSYGSLGILTEVQMDLLPAKEYVELEYIKVESFEDAQNIIEDQCENDVDFIDGIMFSRDRGVIMVGELSDGEDNLPESRFTRMWDEWFYIHADKITKNKEGYREKIPIKDYFFRYDIGAFWAVKYGYEEANLPFNRITRALFHSFNNTEVAYNSGIHGGNLSSEYVIQDIITKRENTQELLEWSDEHLDIYPIWLLPIKPEEDSKLAPSYIDTDLAINVGIWGRPQSDGEPEELKEELEQKQIELGARKTLYAQQFYSEDEFWQIYDEDRYRSLREKYGAKDAFPSVYEVTHVDDLPEPSFLKAAKEMLKTKISSR